ncbi:triose-phosphate isomerase [Alkalibacter rhizosphaerae]|uniref:Triosephosphate isomerase n=1 Tax=Alkalibacter rhizosphaerae TaxID=2815577 RepID=A0A975AH93_9FIRM|nr:triose-phosphate isomerase [Alkalibacter rhizosphaerae]QSX08212.1 triose-phosphate isomerase [Alkalibacter rhizosphaerae]
MRKPIIAGNWKMNKTATEAVALVELLKEKVANKDVKVVFCPPYTSLVAVKEGLDGSTVGLGAQNMHFEDNGAFTGEISADMLLDLGVEYVIIGHSERRQYFNETNETVNKKLHKALEKGLIPIVCVGESLQEREEGIQEAVVTTQVCEAFKNVQADDAAKTVVAYEPIWAIGTGKTATSDQAEEVCRWIRENLEKIYDSEVAQTVRIQYGGSVNASNVDELMGMPNIDGALVGGASLKEDFVRIVQFGA